jgi:hypothetical protein
MIILSHPTLCSYYSIRPRMTLDVRRIPCAMILPLDFCRYWLPSCLHLYAAILAIYVCAPIVIAVTIARLLFFI